jgi:hypothetical protein
LYLSHGGRALFIIPNASTTDLPTVKPKLQYYGEGDFFHDLLHLDSVMINAIVLRDGKLHGDLSGCLSESPGYPDLEADSAKLVLAPVEIGGYIPLAGFLYPQDDVELIYRYQSMYPDSVFHNQVNGIAYADEICRFILFNFQLSLMGEPSNIIALRKALEFLGVDINCGDVNDDSRLDVGDAVLLVNYLFRAGPPPGDWHRADVNCDQEVDLGDAVVIVNVIFWDWPGLNCCDRF